MIEYLLVLLYLLLVGYHHLYYFLIRKKIKGPVKIAENAKPFSKRRGDKVALLIHAFTWSPPEFKELGEYLVKHNISVHAPLLPGHGTSPEVLAFVKYFEWIEFLEKEISRLEQEYKEIYLIGDSFGGNLALLLTKKSKKVKGVITMGTPMVFRRERFLKWAFFIIKRIKIFQRKSYSAKRTQANEGKAHFYMSVPIRTVSQMLKIVFLSREELSSVKVPVMCAYAGLKPLEDEMSAKFLLDKESAEHIMENVSSKHKYLRPINTPFHTILFDKKASKFFHYFISFIKNPNVVPQ
ncbi:MAG: alpha/beta fold hydrolase [archaeon]